jgi:hypothetical protein
MANTWGALTWGQGNWGDASSATVAVTGVSATTSVQDLAFSGAGEGWGRPSWGTGSWGITGDVIGQGQSLTSSVGAVTAEGLVEIGWGRGGWGNRAWGDTYSAQASGQSLTSAIGTATQKVDVSVSVSGLNLLTITQGLNAIKIDSSIFVFVGEPALALSQGSQSLVQSTVESPSTAGLLTGAVGNTVAGLKIGVDVTGIAASLTLGSISLQQSTTEQATGQAAALSLGTAAEIPGQMVGVSGFTLTSSAGAISSVTGTATVDVTGIGLTANIGTPIITAWQEVDPGVTNTWTEVDLAA